MTKKYHYRYIFLFLACAFMVASFSAVFVQAERSFMHRKFNLEDSPFGKGGVMASQLSCGWVIPYTGQLKGFSYHPDNFNEFMKGFTIRDTVLGDVDLTAIADSNCDISWKQGKFVQTVFQYPKYYYYPEMPGGKVDSGFCPLILLEVVEDFGKLPCIETYGAPIRGDHAYHYGVGWWGTRVRITVDGKYFGVPVHFEQYAVMSSRECRNASDYLNPACDQYPWV